LRPGAIFAARMGIEIAKVYRDYSVSGAKGRDQRPQFDALCRDATKRRFDVIMAWSVDRLGRAWQAVPSAPLAKTAYARYNCCSTSARR
jgi:DNA invertase Pin-like site-specific DNA recombinase